MLNCESAMLDYEAEKHILAAAHHILKALGTSKNLTDDFRRALSEVDCQLSAMTTISESNEEEFSEVQKQLERAERKIMVWESSPSLICCSGSTEASGSLQAVSEIQTLIAGLKGRSENEEGRWAEIASRAQFVLQVAMSRLEEELYHILEQHKQHFEPQYVSFRSASEDVVHAESYISVEDETVEETSKTDGNGGESLEGMVDLVEPCVIPDIKSIANVMFASDYDREFCEAFISVRKDALDEHIVMEKLSIEDVLKLEWNAWNSKIKKWNWLVKVIIRLYLPGEKRFCDQVLGDFGSVSSSCFVEITKASIMCLLNFGEAVAMGPHKPEKLLRLLDMYEVLADLHFDIDSLFSEETGAAVRIEFHELLKKVSDSARVTFLNFRSAIASNASVHPFPGGGIHPLTRYVMNYIRVIAEYGDALNVLVKDENIDDEYAVAETYDGQDISPSTFCPMARHLRSITSTLESNLIDKSKSYRDDALQHIFLMNNIHYMVQKVKDSNLRPFFGDEWIRKHNGKFQQHATSYVGATWSSVISFLREDRNSTIKERCKRFSYAFEEVYKSQTGWRILDPRLREDVQISISQKVILAYRNFVGINNRNDYDKHIKYTTDDLEKLLLDLFAGTPRSLRNSRRW